VQLELAEECKRTEELRVTIAFLSRKLQDLDILADENHILRTDLCNLRGYLEGANWHSSDLEQQKCKVDDSLKLTLTELESERRKNGVKSFNLIVARPSYVFIRGNIIFY
jgi:hypothetical protein